MSDTFHQLVGHLIDTARAHHEATGGVNPHWAEWYAERLIEPVKDLVDEGMQLEELTAWLTEADRRYREESPEVSWPKAYAGWLVGEND